ncbi:MAG: hypothetical protein WAK82_13880 [Streptosporangiaceae bacterium]
MNVSVTQTANGLRSQASGRKNAIRLVMLASAASLARDERTLRVVIVAAIVVVAVARLAREGGNPLDWYFAHGQASAEARHNAEPQKG